MKMYRQWSLGSGKKEELFVSGMYYYSAGLLRVPDPLLIGPDCNNEASVASTVCCCFLFNLSVKVRVA